MLLHDLSPRALDIIVSYGERMSSVIVANIIKRHSFRFACFHTDHKGSAAAECARLGSYKTVL